MQTHIQTDREELHGMFEQTKVSVSPEEFEHVLTIQRKMREEHERLIQAMDRGDLTSEGFLDAAEKNFSAFMKQTKTALGPERYEQMFDTPETDNIFPVDRDAFRAIHGESAPT